MKDFFHAMKKRTIHYKTKGKQILRIFIVYKNKLRGKSSALNTFKTNVAGRNIKPAGFNKLLSISSSSPAFS